MPKVFLTNRNTNPKKFKNNNFTKFNFFILFLITILNPMKINQQQIEIDDINKEILNDLKDDAQKPILQIVIIECCFGL